MVLGLQPTYLRLAGDKEGFDKAIADLRKFGGSSSLPCAEVLLLNGMPQEAIALLDENEEFLAGL